MFAKLLQENKKEYTLFKKINNPIKLTIPKLLRMFFQGLPW